jgi:hypothetical protein
MQPCRPVPGSTLESFYPTIPGWTRATPSSETDAAEAVSRTTVDFERGPSVIGVEIMDSCRNPDVLMMLNESLKTLPPVTPGTTVRLTTINGFPGYEEWTAESRHSEIHVLVGGRFMVKVTGSGVDLATVQKTTQSIPMTKLAGMK